MKPRKPDQFARTVNQFVKSDTDSGYDALLFPDDAIYLLRKEHAWMRRMVTKEKRRLTELACKTRQSGDPRDQVLADYLEARVAQCEDILVLLDQRRK